MLGDRRQSATIRFCGASVRAAPRPGHRFGVRAGGATLKRCFTTFARMIDSRATEFSFRVIAVDGAARCGEIATAHGAVATPAFMPVGTQATVKGLAPDAVRGSGADIVLANTYHLMLRPGAERIARLGGLHAFMNWPRAILTDSGGFQVMSLAPLRRVAEKGVTFRSHIDGATAELTPERAIEVQYLLGADIAMQLDECIKLPAPHDELQRAMRLSLRWAERSKRAFESFARGHGLFAIGQGGDHRELRNESARALMAMDFNGYAIGGLAVGEPQSTMLRVIEEVMSELPMSRPRYLMGVGTPHDMVEAVARGIDMFDCVLPTRNGRHGLAYTRFGPINLKNARHADDERPLDAQSNCPAARDYSRAYLHHLVRANEILGAILLTTANLSYYGQLMAEIRAAITAGRFQEFRAKTAETWTRADTAEVNE
jgi:queuine tRNA-ribosyltransferase